MEGSCRTKGARVGDAHHGDQDHRVEDGWECFDACEFDGNDERRATTFSAGGVVQRAVGWYDEADEEEIDNVEDADTPDDLLGGLWDFLLGVCGLGSCQASKFGSAEGKRGRDEDGTESLEAIEETTGTVWLMPNTSPWSVHVERIFTKIFIPVFGTNVTSGIGGYTATVNNNSQDHEPNTGDDFHCAEHKFNLARLATDPDWP